MAVGAVQSKGFLSYLKAPDLQFAAALVAVIFMMLIPLPTLVLDLMLTLSITASFIILLISIYIREPLDFSTFPTLLLLSTLFRLSLNVATTRSILLDGISGDVSEVIVSFGNFVVGGNYFVGFVIFAILVIINFIVITKGAGRVAEVGARFTLDAMPGKQMAIDAELNAGLIDKNEAKKRRTKVELESDFYGSMDGASKFVRGDAIAGIIITIINIIVGLIIGVTTYDLSIGDSAEVFTLLTVGDGLVSQIPALIISVAAGIVVTRVNGNKDLSDDLTSQLMAYPKAISVASGIVLLMALVPGLPTIPFMVLAVGLFFLARYARTLDISTSIDDKLETKAEEVEKDAGDEIDALLHLDILSLELGVGLIPLIDKNQNGEILERIVSARKQFATELGIIVPMVMVRDNIQLKPGEYQIMLKGNVIGRGNLMVDHLLAMDPGDIIDSIDGILAKEPAYGLDAIWIKKSQKEDANFKGYTVVNCATVIVTHLTKLISENASLLLGRQDTQTLVDTLKEFYPKVVEEVMAPDKLSLGDIVKVLQNLLNEGVSIRDMLSIFETLADYCKQQKNPDVLTRYVRKALSRSIVTKYASPDNKIICITLDRGLEDVIASSIKHFEDGSTSLNLDPSNAQAILNEITNKMAAFESYGSMPVLVCGPGIRWDMYQFISRFVPNLAILAYDEIPSDFGIEAVGIVKISKAG